MTLSSRATRPHDPGGPEPAPEATETPEPTKTQTPETRENRENPETRENPEAPKAPSAGALLRAVDVTLTRGSLTLLSRVSVRVPAGGSIAVTGPAGSGKSALLACLSGVVAPDLGEIWFNGEPLHLLDEKARVALRRRHVGVVDGRTRLLPELTVAENVALPLLLARVRRPEAFAAARHWMERVDVAALSDRRPEGLAPGALRRAAVARALVTGPSVIFADEPAYGLATPDTDHLMRILTSAGRSHGTTLVLATCEERIAAHATRRLVLDGGRKARRRGRS